MTHIWRLEVVHQTLGISQPIVQDSRPRNSEGLTMTTEQAQGIFFFGLFLFTAFGWLVSIFTAREIGRRKQDPQTGLMLGIIFGPIGIIAAGLLDNRPLCPDCRGRVNSIQDAPAKTCQHCNVAFTASKVPVPQVPPKSGANLAVPNPTPTQQS